MGFFKDLISGHEAFFEASEPSKNEIDESEQNKVILINDSVEEERKAA